MDMWVRTGLVAGAVLAAVFAGVGFHRVGMDTDAVYMKEWSCPAYNADTGAKATNVFVVSFVSGGSRSGYKVYEYTTETTAAAQEPSERATDRLGNSVAAINGGAAITDAQVAAATPSGSKNDQKEIDFNDCAEYTKGGDDDDPFVDHCKAAHALHNAGGIGQLVVLVLFAIWVVLKMAGLLKEDDGSHRWINITEMVVVGALLAFGVVGLVSTTTTSHTLAEDMTNSDNGLFDDAWDQYKAKSNWQAGFDNDGTLKGNFAGCAELTELTYLPDVDFVLLGSLFTLVVAVVATARKMVPNADGYKSFAQFQRLI
ncbi:MAG: hypothetical protein ACPGUV_08325 [Polyangiales bacterium]